MNTSIVRENLHSVPARLTLAGLLVAAVGVVVQIIAGVDFPPVPPVFFLLLVPAALILFAPWRWVPVPAILVGLFLTVGLFLSGESARMFDQNLPGGTGGSIGLWIQTVAVTFALVTAVWATVHNFRATDDSASQRSRP